MMNYQQFAKTFDICHPRFLLWNIFEQLCLRVTGKPKFDKLANHSSQFINTYCFQIEIRSVHFQITKFRDLHQGKSRCSMVN